MPPLLSQALVTSDYAAMYHEKVCIAESPGIVPLILKNQKEYKLFTCPVCTENGQNPDLEEDLYLAAEKDHDISSAEGKFISTADFSEAPIHTQCNYFSLDGIKCFTTTQSRNGRCSIHPH